MDRSEPILTASRLRAGVWEGELRTPDGSNALPRIELVHLEAPLPAPDPLPAETAGRWHLRVPIPGALISEGVQTFVIRNAESGARLGAFSIVAGEIFEDDLRAEIDLLRAELDMLKKAFRRHCLETAG